MTTLASKHAGPWVLAALATAMLPAELFACSVPVFRYALERWQADFYEIDVFHRGPLSEADRRRLDELEEHAAINGGTANFEVVRADLDGEPDADLVELWQSLDEPELPCVVVRLPLPGGKRAIVWQGKLDGLSPAVFDSPARREIARRLLSGDAVVWLVAGDPDSKAVQQAASKLKEHLPTLRDEIPLPPGVGLPGSELMSRVPLEVRFASLVVDATDAQESWLLRILRSQAPPEAAPEEPLVAAIFGRGRVIEVFRASDLDEEFLADVSRFLCGACSCQVKQLNPGFDLLTATFWDEELFGSGQTVPMAEHAVSTASPSFGVSLEVPIPPGPPGLTDSEIERDELARVLASGSDSSASPPPSSPLLRWSMISAGVGAIATALFLSRRRGAH